jgi:dihydrosphingosine 1-phosphate phosphatase
VIFTWRILAKSVLHMILPPTFRLLAQAFTLPNRRFYTPATDYKNVPSELGLRPIPSVIDLPEHLRMEMEMDLGMKASGLGFSVKETELRARGGKVNGNKTEQDYGTVYGAGNGDSSWELEKHGSEKDDVKDDVRVKHYDADGTSFSLSTLTLVY